MDCSLPGSSIHGIFQARVLEWVAISFSRGSSLSRDWIGLPHCRQLLYHLSHQGSQLITGMVSAKFLWHQGSLLIFAGPYSWKGFPAGSDGKESACKAGDLGLIPGLGRSPREGNGYPLQYSCLGNSMYRGAWQSTVYGVTKSRTWLND